VEIYLGDAEERLSAIEKALLEGDAIRVQREAHTIKGASANVGASALAELAYSLEKAGKDGELTEGTAMRLGMLEEYGRVRSFFESYLEGFAV